MRPADVWLVEYVRSGRFAVLAVARSLCGLRSLVGGAADFIPLGVLCPPEPPVASPQMSAWRAGPWRAKAEGAGWSECG